ncbi:SH3 domain-containing protein [Streptomyces sp. NPDC058240]|uniref:SH3 domain-containing protein n=1 Tax=Streptomyces sp. NPDC058240 TaxID=3346396 RepID=UPI0036E034DE
MLKIVKRRARHIAACSGAAVAMVLGAPLLAAAAPSQDSVPVEPYATVISQSGVNERQYPSTDSSVLGILSYYDQVGLRCKVRAQDIVGDDVWYLLRDEQAWISARYVVQTGAVPYCKDAQPNGFTSSPQAADAKG